MVRLELSSHDKWWMNAVLDLSKRRDSLIFSSLSGPGAIEHQKWGDSTSIGGPRYLEKGDQSAVGTPMATLDFTK